MPANPAFKATISEWRTILAATKHYRECLAATADAIADEDQQLIAYDNLERLERIIPNIDLQLKDVIQEQTDLVAS